MSLILNADDIADGKNTLQTLAGGMSTKVVHGDECSVMLATREPGYHSQPHRHESEQLNYVASGEMWFFVEERGYVAKAGDFFRIPANAVHWAWIRGDEPATTFQVHSPPLEVGTNAHAAPLYDDNETPSPRGTSRNIPVEGEKYRRAEQRMLEEVGEAP